MVDINSHYPTSFSGYYGIGKAREMTQKELTTDWSVYDLESIPIFVCDCHVIPPDKVYEFVSPIPQRYSNELTWSYVECDQTLCSIDILSALKRGWKVILKKGEIFSRKALLFRSYVKQFAKMKEEGTKNKNDLQRMCSKIGLNACIGKMGEHKKRKTSFFVKNESDFKRLCLLLENSTPYKWYVIVDCISHRGFTEFILEEFDVSENNIPIHIAVVMYAYSRWILRDLIDKADCNSKLIIENGEIVYSEEEPDIYYGDTDSIVVKLIKFLHLLKNSPELFQPSVGVYEPQLKKFDYHVAVEDLFEKNAISVMSIFFSLKAYMLFTNQPGSKIRCRGHKIAKSTDKCPCNLGFFQWFCPYCAHIEPPANITGVTLNHFYSVLREEQQYKLTYNRFERQLNRPQGKNKKLFSVRNIIRTIKFQFKEPKHKYLVKMPLCFPKYRKNGGTVD